MNGRGVIWLALAALASLSLAGCGQSSHADLDAYVAQIKARPAPPIEAMPKIVAYTPFTYKDDGRRSPFVPPSAIRTPSTSNIHPNLNRPLGPLEKFPLDALTLVGTITANGITYALIQDPNGVIHQAAPGTHLGRNYGEINHVDRDGVSLTEIVPDGNGGYKKKKAMLTPPTDGTP